MILDKSVSSVTALLSVEMISLFNVSYHLEVSSQLSSHRELVENAARERLF